MAELPEAAKSATVRVISPDGFHWLCTVRGDEQTLLLDKMLAFEEAVLNANFTPEEPFAKPAQPKRATCEKCGAPAEEKQGTGKNGKPYHAIFCSSGDRTHARWL